MFKSDMIKVDLNLWFNTRKVVLYELFMFYDTMGYQRQNHVCLFCHISAHIHTTLTLFTAALHHRPHTHSGTHRTPP